MAYSILFLGMSAAVVENVKRYSVATLFKRPRLDLGIFHLVAFLDKCSRSHILCHMLPLKSPLSPFGRVSLILRTPVRILGLP